MHALDDGLAPLLGQDMSSVVVTRGWGSAGQEAARGLSLQERMHWAVILPHVVSVDCPSDIGCASPGRVIVTAGPVTLRRHLCSAFAVGRSCR